MRLVGDDADLELAERFCESHPMGHFMQSTKWAGVKSNWENEIIVAEGSSGEITGVLSVLIRKIPVFGNLMYCPRGPVCDIHDADALRQLTEGAAFLARWYGAMALRMEPDVPEGDGAFRTIMESLGYQIRDKVKSSSDTTYASPKGGAWRFGRERRRTSPYSTGSWRRRPAGTGLSYGPWRITGGSGTSWGRST